MVLVTIPDGATVCLGVLVLVTGVFPACSPRAGPPALLITPDLLRPGGLLAHSLSLLPFFSKTRLLAQKERIPRFSLAPLSFFSCFSVLGDSSRELETWRFGDALQR
jgi:hypothetical protein